MTARTDEDGFHCPQCAGGAMRVRYGAAYLAHATWEGTRDSLTVSLDRDPGHGSMLFTRISPACVDIIAGAPADLMRAAAYLRKGARYLTPGVPAVARYLREAARLETMADDLREDIAEQTGTCDGCGQTVTRYGSQGLWHRDAYTCPDGAMHAAEVTP